VSLDNVKEQQVFAVNLGIKYYLILVSLICILTQMRNSITYQKRYYIKITYDTYPYPLFLIKKKRLHKIP